MCVLLFFFVGGIVGRIREVQRCRREVGESVGVCACVWVCVCV